MPARHIKEQKKVIRFKYLFQYVKTYMADEIGCVIGFSIYFSMLLYVLKQLEKHLISLHCNKYSERFPFRGCSC